MFSSVELGLGVWCVPASSVIHVGGGGSTNETRQTLFHHNRSVFLDRWKDELRDRPAFGDGPDVVQRLGRGE